MHHPHRKYSTMLWSLLLGLTLSGTAPAQQPVAPPPPVPGGKPAAAGTALFVPLNGTKFLKMATKRRIRDIRYEDPPAIVKVEPVRDDPTTVVVIGLAPGTKRVQLIDENGVQEDFDIVVQIDLEQLRTMLRQAVPTANLGLIPGPNNYVVLTGEVARIEDIEVIMRIATSAMGLPEKVINNMRVGGVQQVQIDVVVARVNRSKTRNFGFSFFETGQQHFISSNIGGNGSLLTTPTSVNVLQPAATLTQSPNLILGIANDKQGFFGFLQAMRVEGLAKVLAEPRVVTLSGVEAYIVSGGETPILTVSGLGAPTVTYKQFGTVVRFIPTVLGNGKIRLKVAPEVSRRNDANSLTIQSSIGVTSVPGFETQKVDATVEIESGQTLVLGGLIQSTVNASTNKVPVLGELPFIGAAFSTKTYQETEEELVILATPYLVDPMACNQLPPYLPGQETRSPDDFELFLEGILEAPRGPRSVCPDTRYVPAYKNGPTSAVYPCAGNGHGAGRVGGLGGASCPNPACAPSPNPGTHPLGTLEARPMIQEDVSPRTSANGPANSAPETNPSPDVAAGATRKPASSPPGAPGTEGQ
jgi:pilus assembly protein CpaC